jgi:Nitrate and nitrite sensing
VAASGRDQHLARLDSAVVTLAGALEDERDLSAAGIGAGYPPVAVHAVADLLAGITDLRTIRAGVSSSAFPPSQVIRVYTAGVIGPADTFAAAVGDTPLQATATSLAALLRVENDQSVQRGILYAALSAYPPVLRSEELSSLQQAADDRNSDLAAFNSSASPAEQRLFASTVSGATVDIASSSEILAEQSAATHPSAPLTMNAWLNAASCYRNMSTAIDDTRTVTGRLAAKLSSRAGTLKSSAARNLLLTSAATLALLLALLVSAGLARPLRG